MHRPPYWKRLATSSVVYFVGIIVVAVWIANTEGSSDVIIGRGGAFLVLMLPIIGIAWAIHAIRGWLARAAARRREIDALLQSARLARQSWSPSEYPASSGGQVIEGFAEPAHSPDQGRSR